MPEFRTLLTIYLPFLVASTSLGCLHVQRPAPDPCTQGNIAACVALGERVDQLRASELAACEGNQSVCIKPTEDRSTAMARVQKIAYASNIRSCAAKHPAACERAAQYLMSAQVPEEKYASTSFMAAHLFSMACELGRESSCPLMFATTRAQERKIANRQLPGSRAKIWLPPGFRRVPHQPAWFDPHTRTLVEVMELTGEPGAKVSTAEVLHLAYKAMGLRVMKTEDQIQFFGKTKVGSLKGRVLTEGDEITQVKCTTHGPLISKDVDKILQSVVVDKKARLDAQRMLGITIRLAKGLRLNRGQLNAAEYHHRRRRKSNRTTAPQIRVKYSAWPKRVPVDSSSMAAYISKVLTKESGTKENAEIRRGTHNSYDSSEMTFQVKKKGQVLWKHLRAIVNADDENIPRGLFVVEASVAVKDRRWQKKLLRVVKTLRPSPSKENSLSGPEPEEYNAASSTPPSHPQRPKGARVDALRGGALTVQDKHGAKENASEAEVEAGSFRPLDPFHAGLYIGSGYGRLQGATAESQQIGQDGPTLAFRVHFDLYDLISTSISMGTIFVGDSEGFEQNVRDGSGRTFSKESSLNITIIGLSAGLRTPEFCLWRSETGAPLGISAYARYGNAWISGGRSISNCINCRTEDVALNGGTFVESGVDLGLKAGNGWGMFGSAGYRHYFSGSSARNEIQIGVGVSYW